MNETRCADRAEGKMEEEGVEPCFSSNDGVNDQEGHRITKKHRSFDDGAGQIEAD